MAWESPDLKFLSDEALVTLLGKLPTPQDLLIQDVQNLEW
jgi:hypothetical protein